LQDLLQVIPIDIAVPDRLRIDDDDRSFATTSQTTSAVDTDAPLSSDAQLLGPRLEIAAQLLGPILGATLTAVLTTVGAHEEVMAIIGHDEN